MAEAARDSSRPAAWRDARRWRAWLVFMLVFYVTFFPVYIAAGHIAASSGRTVELFFAWERDIPLIPWMIWPYLSLYPVFLLPLLHMTPGQMSVLTWQSAVSVLIAGMVFVLIPGRLGFSPTLVTGMLTPLFDLMTAVDTPHNLVPSLHVTFAALILFGCAEQASRPLAWIYRLWLAVMCASTVFVHQHHLLDVATGLGLAAAVRRVLPLDEVVTGRGERHDARVLGGR
jgi:membrane-associated phospholipid phosphatase